MKRKLFLIVIVVLMSFVISCSKTEDKKTEKTNDTKNVAKVNSKVITRKDFVDNYNFVKFRVRSTAGKDFFEKKENAQRINQIKNQIREDLIVESILLQDAKTFKINIPSKKVDEEYEKFVKANEKNKEFNKYLEINGLGEKFIKNGIKNQLTLQKYSQELKKEFQKDSAKINDILTKEFYDVKASHILIKDEKEAKQIYETIKKDPSKFEEIAKTKSVDKGSAKKGGDLGYFTRGTMVKEFENIAFSQAKGKISEPVRSQFGYHIIKTVDKRTIADYKALSSIKPEDVKKAEEKMLEGYYNTKIRERIEGLQKKAKIERIGSVTEEIKTEDKKKDKKEEKTEDKKEEKKDNKK